MQPKPKSWDVEENISFVILILAVVVVGLLMLLLIRVQRGLLGVVLAAVAAALLIYWLREIRKTVKEEWMVSPPPNQKWSYDLINGESELTVITEVPGPESQVKANLVGRTLEIVGGRNFYRRINIPQEVEYSRITYNNGILEVKLKKK